MIIQNFKKRFQAFKLALNWTYKASKPLTILIILISVFGGLLSIIEPYIFKLVIDSLTIDLSDEAKLGFGLLGIFVLYGLVRILKDIFWDVANLIKRAHAYRNEENTHYNIMKHISSLDLVYFEDPNYYNTLSRATSNMWRVIEVFWSITFLLNNFVSVFVIFSALIFFDWRIVIIIALGTIPSIILALNTSELIWSAFVESSPISRHAYYYKSLLTDEPQAIKEIRSFGLKEHFLKKFRKLFGSFITKQNNVAKKQLKWYFIIAIVEGSLSVLAAYLVVKSYFAGNITLGSLTFYWALLFQFAEHVRWSVRLLTDLNTHATFLTPLIELLNFKSTILETNKPKQFPSIIKNGIEFRNVTFYYPRSKKPALRNINLFIKPKESIALVGENGSGKTTLIKLLSRLYDVNDGEILIDGINIKEFKLDDLYKNIGAIFQDFMKYEALIQENISFGRLERKSEKEKIHSSAVKTGAWEFIKDFEEKYKTQLGKRLKDKGVELSIGQWQKIALARALFRDAQILILDEPTSAVDAKAEYKLFKRFKEITKNNITILISHRFSTVRMANKISVIHNGQIIESGSHNELLNKNGRYARLFRLQAKGYS